MRKVKLVQGYKVNSTERHKVAPLFPPKSTFSGNIIHVVLTLLIVGFTLIILFGEVLLLPVEKSIWCESYDPKRDVHVYGEIIVEGGSSDEVEEVNPECANADHISDPCRYERIPYLFGVTIEECDFSRRLLASVILGGIIGYERKAAERPAGIRTMGLVSLGACFFTICSQLAFKSSTMCWDASRVSAAIPSGVGFLGAGLIWKSSIDVTDGQVHQVHGLTTAAVVWLSASVGVGCGGSMFFNTIFATVLVLMVLRFGPKMYLTDEAEDEYELEEENEDKSPDHLTKESSPASSKTLGLSVKKEEETTAETQSHLSVEKTLKSPSKHAHTFVYGSFVEPTKQN